MTIFHPSNFQLKWALREKLLNASPAVVGGLGAALRLVLTHKSLRDKFTGVNSELEEAGCRSIQVTDTGFRLIRGVDIKEVDNLGNPEMVELLNKLDNDVNNDNVSPAAVSPLGNDDASLDPSLQDAPSHIHHSISSASSSSRPSSYSDISSDVEDSGFLSKADLQCPECGQQVLQKPDDQLSNIPRQRHEYYNLTWLEDTESGLYWCLDETELLGALCHSPTHEVDMAPVVSKVYKEVCHDVTTQEYSQYPQEQRPQVPKEVYNDVNERKCETVEKEE